MALVVLAVLGEDAAAGMHARLQKRPIIKILALGSTACWLSGGAENWLCCSGSRIGEAILERAAVVVHTSVSWRSTICLSPPQNLSKGLEFGQIRYPMEHGGRPMNASDRFLRFAAECELMAKFTPSSENEAVWHRMAERWIRCAELIERQESVAHAAGSMKRDRKPAQSFAH